MKCIASVEKPGECLMCGSDEVSSKVEKGKIYVFSECSYDLKADIEKTLREIDYLLDVAQSRLEQMK